MTGINVDLPAMLAGAEGPTAEFAYVDESGNTGVPATGGTNTYTLGCLLLPIDSWTDRLDVMVAMRRSLVADYGLRLRHEVKANNLLKSRGPLKDLNLGDGQRRDIYKRHMEIVRVIASGAFGVVIRKDLPRSPVNPDEKAWEYLLQRLRIRSQLTGRPIILVHDEGEDARVRAHHRRFRRHSFAPNRQSVQARLLVEDPVPRTSSDSYFIQLADLIAYAAFRRVIPPGDKAGSVCNQLMWNELGPTVLTEVSTSRPDGIVVWPT